MLPEKSNFIHISSNKLKLEDPQKPPPSAPKLYITVIAISFLVSSTICALGLLCFYNTLQSQPPEPSTFIARSQWGAQPATSHTELDHPLKFVIIAHTATALCHNFQECSAQVRSMQEHHLLLGYSDVFYNFLIGGDGKVYEGRGWDALSRVGRKDSVTVSFIGNFMHDQLDEKMVEALQTLLVQGVELRKLEDGYKVVCHNQTVATLSPGVNVVKYVKTLERYQPGKLESQ